MYILDEISKIESEEEDEELPKARVPERFLNKESRYIQDPKTKYDYCLKFAKIIGFPVGKVLKETTGWPMSWMYEMDSYLKTYRDLTGKQKYINWVLKNGRTKYVED